MKYSDNFIAVFSIGIALVFSGAWYQLKIDSAKMQEEIQRIKHSTVCWGEVEDQFGNKHVSRGKTVRDIL